MKEKLLYYFQKHNKFVSLKDIVKDLNILESEYSELIDTLFDLQCSGNIFTEDNEYFMRTPANFIYELGKVDVSSKGNKYIELANGDIALIKDKYAKLVKKGDYIYFEKKKSGKHDHLYNAIVKEIISKITLKKNYLVKSILEKDFNKNYYYINIDGRRISVVNDSLNGVFVGDEVIARINDDNHECVAKIEKVLKRQKYEHVFVVVEENECLIAKSITMPQTKIFNIPNKARIGDYLTYAIDENNNYKFIASDEGLTDNIMAYASENGFEVKFSENVMQEAKRMKKFVDEEDMKNRVDLRNLITFTIDGIYSKDLDDAVSLIKEENHFILYVSIADVSYYIKKGSYLYETAKKRSTSIYPLDRVIPMFPFEISNGVCSLNEGEEKLAKTVKMEIDFNGKVIGYDIFNSVIKSDKKMSYDKVNKLLEGTSIIEDYLPFYKILVDMNQLSNILQQRRMKRGFICLNTDEYEFQIDEKGNVESVMTREKGQSQLMIENFMLITNETVAEFVNYLGLNCSYRCHPAPSIEQLYSLRKKLTSIGRYIRTLNNADNPKLLQNILVNLIGNKNEEGTKAISRIMLSNMPRAYYSTYNIGHYGLALNHYATFTSPIRRFPDILNHMVVEAIISGNYENMADITKDYEEISKYASDMQLNADKFEREIETIAMRKYLTKFDGKEIFAKIIFISDKYLFIRTKNNGICGIIPYSKSVKKVGDSITINNQRLSVGDTVIVMFNRVKDYFNDIEFTLIAKSNDKIKSLKKVRREI